MDDIQLLLYVVFVVIAILARAFKSSRKNKPAPQLTEDEPRQKPRKQLSFEELLREFEGSMNPKVEEPIQEEPQYETIESPRFEKTEIVPPPNEEKRGRPVKKEPDYVDDRHTGNFRHFEGYEEEKEEANVFADMLRNPDDAKKAIILSEIIKRKY